MHCLNSLKISLSIILMQIFDPSDYLPQTEFQSLLYTSADFAIILGIDRYVAKLIYDALNKTQKILYTYELRLLLHLKSPHIDFNSFNRSDYIDHTRMDERSFDKLITSMKD
jgi:hypothetical protein